jgi:predicted nucleic acid-binding protein
MAEPLDQVPGGSNLLIDANIFVYGLTAKSSQCKTFLERCSSEELSGIALFESVCNATHQFMKAEAIQKGYCYGQALKFLAQHPEVLRRLSDYWINTQRLLALNLLFIPLDGGMVTEAQVERKAAGLLTNDSLIVAAMREYGIAHLASNDRTFDRVAGITVYAPTDIP